MKYIWLGIKDYYKDCLHDWHLRRLEKMYGDMPMFYTAEDEDAWIAVIDWKEGSLWYYINQRKIAKRSKNARHNDVL